MISTRDLRLTALGAAGLMVIGALGPWIVVAATGENLANGSDRDGSIIIGCAVAYAIAIMLFRRRFYLLFAALAAAIAVVTAIVDLQDVESEGLLDAGWGLWLDTAAAIIALLLVMGLRRRPREKS
ncbi:MAG: hypothetical protein ACJ762_03345 [Solirubrobacteraceae bacterium]